ncbi:hypothetical protein E0I26_09920 [Flavobacterium rhamnosiphilum]|uniref:Addiction module component n=1 Tax=Flavobacterium rhamnosiphilum TaxID=2541724 RepID=A0A4R5F7B4_9FLAO|nr:hypothetical protein [Flavobacterium rhamnosiphilum]TDE43927.1 hypothetical protein E0I26_09920 [Flavobacterium rhamnosiphilum]
MNTAEIKLELIAQIIATNDRILLDRIKEIINSYESNLSVSVNEPTSTYEKVASEKIYIFNEWQQKRIDVALKQVENGEYISDEEAQIEIEKWFEEQEK